MFVYTVLIYGKSLMTISFEVFLCFIVKVVQFPAITLPFAIIRSLHEALTAPVQQTGITDK
jgi:hypothetical protein